VSSDLCSVPVPLPVCLPVWPLSSALVPGWVGGCPGFACVLRWLAPCALFGCMWEVGLCFPAFLGGSLGGCCRCLGSSRAINDGGPAVPEDRVPGLLPLHRLLPPAPAMHALLFWGRPLGARHFSYPSLRPIDQPLLLRRFHPTALAQLRCILRHMVEGSAPAR